jgi:hypothetical protein
MELDLPTPVSHPPPWEFSCTATPKSMFASILKWMFANIKIILKTLDQPDRNLQVLSEILSLKNPYHSSICPIIIVLVFCTHIYLLQNLITKIFRLSKDKVSFNSNLSA